MPWYDYLCYNCEHEFTEVFSIDDRNIPVEADCPECGEREIRKLIGNVMMADSVNLGITKPDAAYGEVISKINEASGIKGTRYQLEDRMEQREKNKQKPISKYEIKQRVHENVKANKKKVTL